MSEVPMPRPRTSDRTASSPMNEKASATLRSADEARAGREVIVSGGRRNRVSDCETHR